MCLNKSEVDTKKNSTKPVVQICAQIGSYITFNTADLHVSQ